LEGCRAVGEKNHRHRNRRASEFPADPLKLFTGTHPKVIQPWLPKEEGLLQADPNHQLTSREKKAPANVVAGKNLQTEIQQKALHADPVIFAA
jgi:hypothetical protein